VTISFSKRTLLHEVSYSVISAGMSEEAEKKHEKRQSGNPGPGENSNRVKFCLFLSTRGSGNKVPRILNLTNIYGGKLSTSRF
jgi:hypothetical protein